MVRGVLKTQAIGTRWLLLKWFLAALVYGTCVQAPALDFAYRHDVALDSGGGEILLISGEIRSGDADRFRRFVLSDPDRYAAHTIILDSPGGNVQEAIALAALFEELKVYVAVYPPYHCLSACFLLYVAAAVHIASSPGDPVPIGVHRPYLTHDVLSRLSIDEARKQQVVIADRYRKWLQDHLVPQSIIDNALTRPSTDVYWLTLDDAKTIGRYAPGVDELLLQRCPALMQAERRLFAKNATDFERNAAREDSRKHLRCATNVLFDAQAATLVRWTKQRQR